MEGWRKVGESIEAVMVSNLDDSRTNAKCLGESEARIRTLFVVVLALTWKVSSTFITEAQSFNQCKISPHFKETMEDTCSCSTL